MIKQIDHIGIAVKSLEQAVPFYEQVLGLTSSGREEVISQKVTTVFFNLNGVQIELLQPTDPESPIAKFIEKHGEGIHHLGYLTDDLEGDLNKAKNCSYKLINETPIDGANEKKIAFLHPKSTHGVLTEFCCK